jgi:ABC-type multidrug transport system fused ATPase/permease subunit
MNLNRVDIVDILRKHKYSFEKEEDQIKVKLARRLFFIISFKEGQQTFSYYLKGTFVHPKNTFTFEWIWLVVLSLLMLVVMFILDFSLISIVIFLPLIYFFNELLYYHRRLYVVKKRLGISKEYVRNVSNGKCE